MYTVKVCFISKWYICIHLSLLVIIDLASAGLIGYVLVVYGKGKPLFERVCCSFWSEVDWDVDNNWKSSKIKMLVL